MFDAPENRNMIVLMDPSVQRHLLFNEPHQLFQVETAVLLSRFLKICDWLESFIDPFDLDVFTPPLNANLNRLSQRTSVLLGLLTGSEKQFPPRSSAVTSQEPFNILPLASSQIRFGLLPLSMSNARKSKSSSRGSDVSQKLAPPSSTAGSDDSFQPGGLFRQLADQDEDSTAPSLFKLSWLSGMAK